MNNVFIDLYRKVKVEQNYVERDYKTIGGMWTVDTWKKQFNDITIICNLMDEGYTKRLCIFQNTKMIGEAFMNFDNSIDYKLGDEKIFEKALKEIDNFTD